MYDSTDLLINCYQLLSDAYRIYHLRNFYTTDNLRIALEDNLIENSGLVHTMPDKFENATLLLRLGLPSTLQRTYSHKKIRENGTF